MKTGIEFDAAAVFAAEFAKATAEEQAKSGYPEISSWFWSGNQKPETAMANWDANGPILVQRVIDWYETHEDVSIWHTPDGTPSIELALEVKFGIVPVKMAIDVVFQMGTALVVVDWKTSAKAPENPRQLGIYASGIELEYGIRPKYGAYFLPKDEQPFQRPIDLTAPQFGIPYLTSEFELFHKGRTEGIFVANPGRSCRMCGVGHACLANGGAQARKLDPAHPAFNRSSLAP
jgi:hypothetical protein